YPRLRNRRYECPGTSEDRALAARIDELANGLHGVNRVGPELRVPPGAGLEDERYLRQVVASARALARYHVMAALRSSRAAVIEHCVGSARALAFAGGLKVERSSPGMASRLRRLAGKLPRFALRPEVRASAPAWLVDSEAHRESCERDA